MWKVFIFLFFGSSYIKKLIDDFLISIIIFTTLDYFWKIIKRVVRLYLENKIEYSLRKKSVIVIVIIIIIDYGKKIIEQMQQGPGHLL